MLTGLFVDCETTGLCDMRTPYNEDTLFKAGWPYVTQLSYTVIRFTDNMNSTEALCSETKYLKPEYSVQKYDVAAQKVTGITYEKLQEEGEDVKSVLSGFVQWLETVDFVVAHNAVFDMKMLKAECLRHGFDTHMRIKPWLDTMYHGTEYLRSIGATKSRYIKLGELYSRLTGKTVDSAHTANSDVATMVVCFLELVKLHTITEERINLRMISNQEQLKERENVH